MDKIEATLVQAYNYARAFIVSSIKHAELRAKELERKLESFNSESFNGKLTRLKIATLLAKAEYWLDCSDEDVAWLLDVGERVGIARWDLRNIRDARAKENALRLIQEIRRKLWVIRQKSKICLSGIIFEIEKDAAILIKHPEIFEEEEERRKLIEEIKKFEKEIDEEVRKRVKKILRVKEDEVIEV
ncbi:hypothetical protein DRP04_07400 [Archaeoglobales archaeon]|nr:MAG: hypothetical protein DRP04_07400 [Archaeoglobales archaeon]